MKTVELRPAGRGEREVRFGRSEPGQFLCWSRMKDFWVLPAQPIKLTLCVTQEKSEASPQAHEFYTVPLGPMEELSNFCSLYSSEKDDGRRINISDRAMERLLTLIDKDRPFWVWVLR